MPISLEKTNRHRSLTATVLLSRHGDSGYCSLGWFCRCVAVRSRLTCHRICLGLFLSMIDSSVVSTCLYTIGLEFHATGSVNWVALAYTLAYLACAVTVARLSDIIGRRNAFIVSHALFLSFSLACGFAQNINQLIAFRAVQGIGGSGKTTAFQQLGRANNANRALLPFHGCHTRIVPEKCTKLYFGHCRDSHCWIQCRRTGSWWHSDALCQLEMGVLDQVQPHPAWLYFS